MSIRQLIGSLSANVGPVSALASVVLKSSLRVPAWKFFGIGVPTFAAGAVLTTDDPAATVKMCRNVPLRLWRDVYTAAVIVLDYKRSLRGLEEGDTRDAAKAGCHERGARRLLELCFANGGIYIKLGQHLGQLDHLLPAQYVRTMRENLLDRCPLSPPDEVRRIILEDLGQPPEELYASFDWTPIASASLAQVHVATSASGEKLAVKVQHEGLREASNADIATIEALVRAVRWLYPDFDYMWLVEETKENLPLELDFRHEAANAERCREQLESPRSAVRGRVVVPHIHHELSSARVLTMEFVDGVKVTDLAGLRRLGASPKEVAHLVSQTFNQMIFIFGDVHCDPHAANLLVRKKSPKDKWQLVLLDHGLYRCIDDELRMEYAGLWRSLIFGDVQGIKQHAASMNAGDAYPLFAAMLTSRPWDDIVRQTSDHLELERSQEERVQLQHYASVYAKEISELLLKMPRPLLLLLKTNDCLRAVDLALGQPVNTFSIMARECQRALTESAAASHWGLAAALVRLKERLALELRVALLQLLTWMHSWGLALTPTPARAAHGEPLEAATPP